MNGSALDRSSIVERILDRRLIAVVRAADADEALQVGKALAEGGVDLIEITFTVPDAPSAIARLTRALPEAVVGAGSVTTPEQAEDAISAGARFVVSPVGQLDLIAACHRRDVVCMVAGLTPTELFHAWQSGADLVKLFPAGAVGGPSYVRSVLAPLPDLPLVPTGGVTFENFRAYLAAGAKAVGLGGALIPKDLVRSGDWRALAEHAARFVQALADE